MTRYILFTCRDCPACRELEEYLAGRRRRKLCAGFAVSAETPRGRKLANLYRVKGHPVAIVFDNEWEERVRCRSVPGLMEWIL